VAAHLYASQQGGRLFPHRRINGDWAGFNLPTRTFSQITNLAGETAVDCPNLYPFTMPGQVYTPGTRATANEGAVLGYIYCGGIDETNMLRRYGWESPLTSSADPSWPLFVDLNASGWDQQFWAIAPHTATGPRRLLGNTYLILQAHLKPIDLQAEGGNVGSLDGAVEWRAARRMKQDNWIYKYYFEARGMW
jgi:hypothetical protein